ncbi:unnamed protein product, partial [Brassica rapa]
MLDESTRLMIETGNGHLVINYDQKVIDIITKLEEALLLEPKKHVGIMDWFHGLRKSRDKGISSWGEPDTELKLSCRQRSPFLQNNYRDSSFKQLFFVYTLVNTGKERAKVSLIFYMGEVKMGLWRPLKSQVPLLHAEIHMLGFGTLILSGTSQSVASIFNIIIIFHFQYMCFYYVNKSKYSVFSK